MNSREFQIQRTLAARLRQLAAAQKDMAAPPRVESALRAAFRQQAAQPALSPRLWRWAPALAAVLVLAVFLGWQRRPLSQPVAPLETAESMGNDSGFFPLASAEAVPSEDEADLVRVELPRSTLLAWGVPVTEGETGEAVEAEVLLGAGGAPQAVRLLP
jgi:hypothetical protein